MTKVTIQKGRTSKKQNVSDTHVFLMGLCDSTINLYRMANIQSVNVLKLALKEVCKDKELPCSIEFSDEEITERCQLVSVLTDGEDSYEELEVERIYVRDIEHYDFDLVGHILDHQQETYFSDTIKDGEDITLAMNIISCKI